MNEMIKVARPCLGREEEEAVIEVLRSEWYTSGPRVKKFEEAFAEYVGTDYAVGVSSGTSAIYLTLQALGIGAGDEVVVPAMTFFSTATAVLRVGATPIFADVDNNCNLGTKDTVCRLTERTKAIIPVHFYGQPIEMTPLLKIAEEHDIYIIEDAAQAHGAEYRNQKVGSLGKAGTWSFFATKNMTTACEGGMITTDDEKLADTARILRSHGMIDRDTHWYLGYNDRMDEVAAAIGYEQLKKLDKMNEIRIINSLYLRKKLSDVPWLKFPEIPNHVQHVFFWCNVEIDEKELGFDTFSLREVLLEKGIQTRHRYWQPLYKQPILEKFSHLHDYSEDYCPNAERLAGRIIGLPNHVHLVPEQLDYIVDTIKAI